MFKLRQLIGWTKANVYCQGTVCLRCVLAVLRTVKLGLTDVGNQANTHLTATYKDRWTGRGGPMACPPRSPDLIRMEFFLLAHITALNYTSPFDSEEDLIACNVEAAVTTRQQPGIFERSRHSLLRRCRLCIAVGGGTFEHLL